MEEEAWSPFVCLFDRGPRDPWPPRPPPRAVLLPRAGRDCTSDMCVVWEVCKRRRTVVWAREWWRSVVTKAGRSSPRAKRTSKRLALRMRRCLRTHKCRLGREVAGLRWVVVHSMWAGKRRRKRFAASQLRVRAATGHVHAFRRATPVMSDDLFDDPPEPGCAIRSTPTPNHGARPRQLPLHDPHSKAWPTGQSGSYAVCHQSPRLLLPHLQNPPATASFPARECAAPQPPYHLLQSTPRPRPPR